MQDPQVPPVNETPEQRDIRENKDIAAFSYLWVMSVLIYASRRDSPFIRYHSKQGIVLFLISIPVYLLPVVGHFLALIVVAGMLLGFINAAGGKYADVPLAGELAKGTLKLSDVVSIVRKTAVDVVSIARELWHRFFEKKPPVAPQPPVPPEQPPSA